jgi:hypothetical protein
MNKSLPSKWIRKAAFDNLNGIFINNEVIPVYDEQVSGPIIPAHYILMTTQISDVDKNNKCEWFWNSSILLDIVTSYEKPGNPGSKLLADDIAEAVRDITKDLQLDTESGLEIITITQSFPPNITTVGDVENVFRNFVRLELIIK